MDFCKFNGINKEEMTNIIPYLQIAKFSVGDYIFKTGDDPINFYCILKGKISIQMPEIKSRKLKKIDDNPNGINTFKNKFQTKPPTEITIEEKHKELLKEQREVHQRYNRNLCI